MGPDIGEFAAARRTVRRLGLPIVGGRVYVPPLASPPVTKSTMSKGSYRGGSTITGWNAAAYVSPGRLGRKAVGAKTAQTRSESAARDAEVRKRHGLMPRKPNLVAREQAKVEEKARLRRTSRTSAPIVVKVKRRRAGPRPPKPKRPRP